jgi:signal transduction histidine kinase
VKIQEEIGVMVQLLDDILFFRRAEDSGVAFNPQSLDLNDFCSTLIGEMQPTIPTHRIEFTTSGDCTRMTADLKLLRQAISNLISNAVKYSPERQGIGLDLICGEREVILHVRDEGIGIPEEDQSKLFEVFHRASNVGSISGTGLGLSIVKQAVEAHGGSIVVASEVDVGTTFTISLPRRA